MSSKTDADGPWAALLIVTLLVAAALRVVNLDSGLWYDEIVTLVESARLPVRQIVTTFTDVNVHPLYSLLAHASIAVFGESAWALRLPACLFGIASVDLAYRLGVRLTSRSEAWAGATMLAASYHHIWFSQNARGYTLLGFFVLLSTLVLLRAREGGHARDYVIYAAACVAGIYTHLTMVFVVAGHAAVVAASRATGWRPSMRLAPLAWTWAAVAAVSALVYAPLMGDLLTVMNADAPRQAARVATASWALGELVRSLSGTVAPAACATAAFAVIGGAIMCHRDPFGFALLIVPGLVTGFMIVALGQPLRPRFFFFLSGAVAVFAGRGIGVTAGAFAKVRFGGRPLSVAAGVVTCTLLLLIVSVPALAENYRLPKQDFDGAVRFLDAADREGAEIHAAGPACLPLEIYYGKVTWPCLTTGDDWRALGGSPSPTLVVYTLADHITDAWLGDRLRADCRVVQRFAGTLGGGDIVVCEPRFEVTTR